MVQRPYRSVIARVLVPYWSVIARVQVPYWSDLIPRVEAKLVVTQ